MKREEEIFDLKEEFIFEKSSYISKRQFIYFYFHGSIIIKQTFNFPFQSLNIYQLPV